MLLCWFGMAVTETSNSSSIPFWVVFGVVVLGLVFYSLLFSFFKEVNKEYQRFNEDAHFVSCKLSMAATHGAILVLLYNYLQVMFNFISEFKKNSFYKIETRRIGAPVVQKDKSTRERLQTP